MCNRFFSLLVLMCCVAVVYAGRDTLLAVSWIEQPSVTGQKAEWQLHLPADVQQAVDAWISNQRDGGNRSPAINPFDPEQLDVRGKVLGPGLPEAGEPVFGFYYEGYARNTSSEDKNQWDWEAVDEERGFRFRWAAPATGIYSMAYWIDLPGRERIAGTHITFEIRNYSWQDQFIGISANGHYLSYRNFQRPEQSGGTVFFPVGKNIWEGAYDCGCAIPCAPLSMLPGEENYPCSVCYQEKDGDLCCGLSLANRMSRCKPWSRESTVRDLCLPVASYLKLHHVIEQVARSGANTLRFPLYPSSFEIEFEKINNYLDRQYQAWELDQVIEKCEALDLHLQLNMGMQSPYQCHPYGAVNWDWFDTNVCDEPGESASWCYRKDLSLEAPFDFFADDAARKFYKKKLRYFIARWGYSSRILLLELFSEMNGAGSGTVYNHPEKGCAWWNKPRHLPMPYNEDMQYRSILSSWNLEMLQYIKTDLGHTRHLLTVNYTGKAPMEGYNDPDPCISENLDSTWLSPHCDVICWNNYSASAHRFREISVDEYGIAGKRAGYRCETGWSATDDRLTGYANTTKPVLYGENGFGDQLMACDHTGFVRDLLAITFSGHASSGMSWDEIDDTSHWAWMGYVRRFMDNQVIRYADLGDGLWEPEYATSAAGGTSLVETVYLKNDRRSDYAAAGVVMNRSWNWFTAGSGGACALPSHEGNLPVFMRALRTAVASEEPLKLPRMGLLRNYRIDYYDPATGALLYTEIQRTLSGRLPLRRYPPLDEKSPAVFFTIKRNARDEGHN